MKTLVGSMILMGLLSNCSTPKSTDNAEMKAPESKMVVSEDDDYIIMMQAESDTIKGSLKAIANGKIGNTVLKINYHSPAVRGRVIWGGLVPMGQVWVTGAHKATILEFDSSLKIGSVDLPAGKYGLFTIPLKDEWTIIINKNWDQHLTDEYDSKDDILRINIKPGTETVNQERLRYVIEPNDNNSGEIVIYWEKLKISLPVSTAN